MVADPRTHVVIQPVSPQTIRPVLTISRIDRVRPKSVTSANPVFRTCSASLAGSKKALPLFATSLSGHQCRGEHLLRLLINEFFRNAIFEDDLRSGWSAARARKVPKIASVERSMVTPSQEKKPGASAR